MEPQDLSATAEALLAAAGCAVKPDEIQALSGGGNNRVYRVAAGGQAFALKAYFNDGSDLRDRLGAEFGFLRFAWRLGLRSVPRPLAADAARRAALYEYVDGRRPAEADMDADRVLECAGLFAALNTPAARRAAGVLPDASDACFSVAQHVSSVDRRLERLVSINGGGAADREATQLVSLIAARWQGERAALLRATPDAEHSIGERCVSPSDFGFHNALVRADRRLCFLDFEYAGWDDPAKMAGDFFWHAGMRPPRRHFEPFVQAAFAGLADPQACVARTRMLFPVFRARWACIALNEFLPDAVRRRQFAGAAAEDSEARKRVQLQKAQVVYADVDS